MRRIVHAALFAAVSVGMIVAAGLMVLSQSVRDRNRVERRRVAAERRARARELVER